jgi:hypothetical protein
MRTENRAIPSRDASPMQVIPSPSSGKNLSRRTRSVIAVYNDEGISEFRTFSRYYVGSDQAARSFKNAKVPINLHVASDGIEAMLFWDAIRGTPMFLAQS